MKYIIIISSSIPKLLVPTFRNNECSITLLLVVEVLSSLVLVLLLL